MYDVYVITKNGFDRIHLELPCLTLKIASFWKSGNMIRSLWIMRFLG